MDFFSNFHINWFFAYIITLFLFDVSPGVSFVITAKNTIKNKSLTMGFFTAFGIACSDGLSSIIGFFFCSILEKHQTIFQYMQMIGMSYLFYVGIKMMTVRQKEYSMDDGPSISKYKFEAFKNGFLYTFSNIGITTVIISVISQFYKYVDGFIGHFGLLLVVPLVSFFTFFLIAFCCYFFKLWFLFGKKAYLMDKIAGFLIILLAITNVKSILGG